MKFLARSFLGLFLFSVTMGLLALAGGQIYWALQQAQNDEGFRRPSQEREFTVDVATFEPTRIAPVITAYGTVKSWRTLDLRASVGGEIVEVSDAFRDGKHVREGDLLFRIDPAEAQSALELAQIALAEAETELTDATAALSLVERELEIANRQLALRTAALTRQQDLKARGVGTDAELETATLAVISAEQAIISQQQAIATANTRIARARIALDRQAIAVTDATRTLEATNLAAPFDGVLSGVSVLRGGQVNANEVLGQLIDPAALEVAFRVSNAQYSRLLDGAGRLQALPITATLDLNDLPFKVSGILDRAGAEVGEGQTGRIVYARLEEAAGDILQPGDFLTISITEQALDNVAVVPASSMTSDGRMLVVGAEQRLESVTVEIVRYQADSVLIADFPAGRDFVMALTPQIGVGIKVNPLRDGTAVSPSEPENITLDPDRRARLIAFIESNDRMPADVKARILGQLQQDEVPKEVVDRLEERMGG